MEFLWLITGVLLAQTLAVVSPEPSLVVVARASVAESRASGMWIAVGLGLGTLVWASAAMFGLQLFFIAFPVLYTALKLLGAAYLLYMAVQLWRHAGEKITLNGDTNRPSTNSMRAVGKGLLIQLSNPKVAVFFGSILATMLPPDAPLWVLLTLLPILALIDVAWYMIVAVAMSNSRFKNGYLGLKPLIDRITGTVLGALGVKLATDS